MSEQRTFNSANLLGFEWHATVGHPAEIERREAAQEKKGQVVVGSGRRGKPKRMAQMVSVRLEPVLLRKALDIMKHNDSTLSEVLREGLRRM